MRAIPVGQYRSTLESDVAKVLKNLGIKFEYETYELMYERPLRNSACTMCGSPAVVQEHTYTPDFWLPEYEYFIEVKGKFGQVDRRKMRLVKQSHPDTEIRMVFSRDNYIGKKSKTRTTYTQYAERYGMPAVVLEDMTEEWLRER